MVGAVAPCEAGSVRVHRLPSARTRSCAYSNSPGRRGAGFGAREVALALQLLELVLPARRRALPPALAVAPWPLAPTAFALRETSR